ncbi:hypothetical protein N7493_010136 [Penicillium malachiteum]|uniref:N-acetyltransferase domain-containing protein n=1 Tax=Penicillium malachiteum TaxID=1324776 RepID=A0AAD6MR83_9EURO|nr:hypothetical protein N7493_010136 [Penicillium malachiteum]
MSKTPVSLTHGKDSLLESVARLNGRIFDTDPVVTYMLLEMSKEERLAYLPTYWSTLVKSALLNDAIITEADGWKAASVIVPPGKHIDNAWKLLYAGFLSIGTEHEHRGKGLTKAIMRQHQKTAQAENVLIWLETTSPSSRDLYFSLGFQEIEEIILGKGKVNADATRQSGGSGIPLYAMVWWPKETNAAAAL